MPKQAIFKSSATLRNSSYKISFTPLSMYLKRWMILGRMMARLWCRYKLLVITLWLTRLTMNDDTETERIVKLRFMMSAYRCGASKLSSPSSLLKCIWSAYSAFLCLKSLNTSYQSPIHKSTSFSSALLLDGNWMNGNTFPWSKRYILA